MGISKISRQLIICGDYIHEVLINTCNILVVYSFNEKGLAGTYFRPRAFLPTNSCPMFVAFIEPEIQ